jgi:hypothetical protein
MTERIIEANGVELCTETFGNPVDPAARPPTNGAAPDTPAPIW